MAERPGADSVNACGEGAGYVRRMSEQSITFLARGLPAPQGSKAFKGFRGGRAIMAESSQKVAPWRQDVVAAAVEAIERIPGWQPITGEVELLIEFYLPRPKGHPKRRRTVPGVTPDLDKLIRSTCDALGTAGVWRDDAQVTDVAARKRYAITDPALGLDHEIAGTGARITVSELHADASWADGGLRPAGALPRIPFDVLAHVAYATPDEPHVAGGWSQAAGVLTIDESTTDAKAVSMLAKAAKSTSVVAIAEGTRRLASVPGKPLSVLQRAVKDYGPLAQIVLLGASSGPGTQMNAQPAVTDPDDSIIARSE